jgi:LacI family gluconate utilization system Gnt-I transcriptional repressor
VTASSSTSSGRARRQASTGQPTLSSVASHAGVSTATVSRYLNMPDIVARDTADRIRAAIDQLGYVPNLLAGGLASNRSRLVAVIVPSVSFSIFNDTIDGIVEALARSGYTAMLGLSGEGDERLGSVIDGAIARRPDGIIITAASTDPIRRKLEQSGITIIETWDLPETPLDIAVGFSHKAVGRALGTFAIAQGSRAPLVISATGRRARLRYEGLVEVLAEQGMPAPPIDYLGGTTRFGEGRRRFAHALDRGEKPDLVICSSDWLAQGVLIEANCRGLTVPQDLGVIGFGDLAFAADMDPPITSVHIPGDQIGERAVEALIRRNDGQAVEQLVDVGFEIVARATTRRRAR